LGKGVAGWEPVTRRRGGASLKAEIFFVPRYYLTFLSHNQQKKTILDTQLTCATCEGYLFKSDGKETMLKLKKYLKHQV
jgi:hypothetical protein